MTTSLQSRVQGQAMRIVLCQFALVLLFAFTALVFKGYPRGYSVLLGGLAYVLPNIIFVWVVFRYVGAAQVAQFLTAFMLGEMLKLFLSAVLFLIIVKTLAVSLLSVLAGYIGAIVAFWIVCFWLFSKKNS